MPRLTMSASSAAPVSGAQTTVKTVAEAAAETMNEAAVETVDEATMKQNHEEAKRGPNCSSAGRACHLAAVRFRHFPVRSAGYVLTRLELLRPSIARRRWIWIIWRWWWIDRRCLQAVQLLLVQLSGNVAA